MTHLVRAGAGRRDETACGLNRLPDGDTVSFTSSDCPKCMPAPPADVAPSPKTARIAFLEKKREATKADLLLKFEDGDYHGVQDCASDLRDIESELKGLRL